MPLGLLRNDNEDENRPSGRSFRSRLHAWWEGYELAAEDDVDDAPAGESEAIDGGSFEWLETRIELVQLLWGEGHIAPGEQENVLDLVGPFGINETNTMLEIGAGLGGGARAIARQFGTYVDAFELNSNLAEEGAEISTRMGLDKKADVRGMDPTAPGLKNDYYEGALIREALIAIEDKQAFLEAVVASLKPNRPLAMIEFFTTSDTPGAAARNALEAENRDVYPCQSDTVVGILEGLGMKISSHVDETGLYGSMVRNEWSSVAGRIAERPPSEEISKALMVEMDLWTSRNIAFELGELKMCRIVGYKKEDE